MGSESEISIVVGALPLLLTSLKRQSSSDPKIHCTLSVGATETSNSIDDSDSGLVTSAVKSPHFLFKADRPFDAKSLGKIVVLSSEKSAIGIGQSSSSRPCEQM